LALKYKAVTSAFALHTKALVNNNLFIIITCQQKLIEMGDQTWAEKRADAVPLSGRGS